MRAHRPRGLDTAVLVQRVWRYAHVLKDDGLAFMDYTEQITYLLFLKMAWEQRSNVTSEIPARYNWGTLRGIGEGPELLERYHQGLRDLSECRGLIGLIFTKPQSKINDPAKLHLLIRMIDSEQWSALDLDVKGDVYEGLLARNAEDVRGGAGQYFTPRPVTRAIVDVMRPTANMTIADPACGTGGFLLAAFDYLRERSAGKTDLAHIRTRGLRGMDLVPNVARLCAMNLFLHGIGMDQGEPVIKIGDSLERGYEPVDMVLTNPPFGKKSSVTFVGQDGRSQRSKIRHKRPDFWATTSNKQLSFVQHVYCMLKDGGRAAVVVPDNVLFEGGAGEKIRRVLLDRTRVHTLLRLPTGIWYSPGVKANVLFFDRFASDRWPATRELWVYDLRSERSFSLKQNPIRSEDLDDFVQSYSAADPGSRKESAVFRRFTYAEVVAREKASLDIWWRRGGIDAIDEENPRVMLGRILDDLSDAMREFAAAEAELAEGVDESSNAFSVAHQGAERGTDRD